MPIQMLPTESEIMKMPLIGSGVFSTVFAYGTDKVIKITVGGETRIDMLLKLAEIGRGPIIHYYSRHHFHSTDRIHERLDHEFKDDSDTFDLLITDRCEVMYVVNSKNMFPRISRERATRLGVICDRLRRHLRNTYNIRWADDHSGNLGWYHNRFVVIDA